MNTNSIIAQTYRQNVRQIAGTAGITANRRDAVPQAASELNRRYKAGEIEIDPYDYFLAKLYKVDEAEGKAADRVIAAALGNTDITLFDVDLDVVVTLGGGKRKPWEFVTAEDLEEMNQLRYRNVRAAERAYFKEWRPAYLRLHPVLQEFATFGDAYRNGGFPPADLTTEAVA